MTACVLVVDDSPTIARIVESVLSGAGYRVITAPSGADGLARARQDQPDLILLDQVMPKMTGYQFCQQLATEEATARIPVVMMTSKGEPGSDRFASGFNVVDYVSKPFSPEVVLALTSHTLDKLMRPQPASAETVRLSTNVRVAIRPPPSFEPGQSHVEPPAELSAEPADGAAVDAAVAAPVDDAEEAEDITQVSAAPSRGADAAEVPAPVPEPLPALEVSAESGEAPAAALPNSILWADLSRVPLPEVMQLLELQAHSGCFRVHTRGTRFDIYLQRGRVRAVRAEGASRELRLGRFLVARGYLAASELEQLASSASGRGGMPLGEKLIRLGHIRADQLRDALADQCRELVYEALRVRGGQCDLQAGAMPPPEFDTMLVDLEIQPLVMEGLRRIDEWGVVEREVPSFDAVFAHRPGGMKDPGEFTSDERRLLMLVDGQRDVHALIGAARMRPFEACKLLYRLAATRQIMQVVPQAALRAEP